MHHSCPGKPCRGIFLPNAVDALDTLVDARKLDRHIPKSSPRYHLGAACRLAAGEDSVNISVALQIVLHGERVPYTVGSSRKGE